MRGISYIWVYLMLMGLLFLTLGAAYLHLRSLNTVVSLVIAGVKASLIMWFFMELNRSRALTRTFAFVGYFWLAVLLSLVLTDYLSRNWTSLPSHWPQPPLKHTVP
jgi:caa(3)-type oxidase subunit IV